MNGLDFLVLVIIVATLIASAAVIRRLVLDMESATDLIGELYTAFVDTAVGSGPPWALSVRPRATMIRAERFLKERDHPFVKYGDRCRICRRDLAGHILEVS